MKIQIVNYGFTVQPKIKLNNLRCQKCGALLGKYTKLTTDCLEIKCRQCKSLNKFTTI